MIKELHGAIKDRVVERPPPQEMLDPIVRDNGRVSQAHFQDLYFEYVSERKGENPATPQGNMRGNCEPECSPNFPPSYSFYKGHPFRMSISSCHFIVVVVRARVMHLT
eukprot:3904137-Pyramimonas_sp.AAC.1